MKNFEEITRNLRQKIEKWDGGEYDHQNYWSCPTEWQRQAVKYGAENIFLTGEGYRSMYHDDYASFTYYNNVTGDFFTDSWTTAAACPSYNSYKCTTLEEAIKDGLLNKELYFSTKMKGIRESIEKTEFPRHLSVDEVKAYKLLVEVKRGRKWRGRGYVVDSFEVSYGWTPTTYAVVFDALANQIEEINFSYCEFVDSDALLEEYKECARKFYDTLTVDEFLNGKRFMRINEWLINRAENVVVDYSNASYPAKEARDKKHAEFKEKKMAELMEWVKTHTDKTGDQILSLAEHIFKKRYC